MNCVQALSLLLSFATFLPACKSTENNESSLTDRFDADVAQIDLGRGIFASSGDIAGPCLRIKGPEDIETQKSFINWKQAKREQTLDINGNPTTEIRTVDIPLVPEQFYWQINLVTNSYDVKKLLEISAAGQYNGAVANASASVRFSNSVQIHQENIYFLIDLYILTNSRKVKFDSPTVELEKRFIPNDNVDGRDRMWYNSCGDAAITEVVYGARRLIMLEIQGYSKEEITRLETKMKGGIASGSGNASLSLQVQELITSNSLGVKGLQIGGELTSLSSLMSVQGIITDSEKWMNDVQRKGQWVPIAYYSDPWTRVPQFSEMQSTSQLGLITGRNYEIESYSRTYATYKDLAAYLNFALTRPYQMTSSADPVNINGQVVPGLTANVKDRIAKLLRKTTEFLQRIEQIAAVCVREKAADVSNCDSEIDLKDKAEVPGESLGGSSQDAAFKAKKYVETLNFIETEKDQLGLSVMTIPELKEHERCAELGEKFAPLFKICAHPNHGVESYAVSSGEVCGVAEYETEASKRCGVMRYNSRHDCKVCGQSGTFGGCKKCENSKFGVAEFKTCSVEPLKAKSFRSCAHPSFGTSYVKARSKHCGIEHHAKCVLLNQGNGDLVPMDPEEYYKKTFSN